MHMVWMGWMNKMQEQQRYRPKSYKRQEIRKTNLFTNHLIAIFKKNHPKNGKLPGNKMA